ncbi:hypothetical protein [Streptomyces sp. NPDC046261]|uniref:hypothetical protein n=1 Tax=Streptomyces sp. NPDC046261 TaxID=3157200 RepID=UPI0034042BF5
MRSSGLGAVVAALALATTPALIPPAAAAAPAACAWTPTLLPRPAGIDSAAVTAADSQGGFAGDGDVWGPWGSSSHHALRWRDGQVTVYADPPGMTDPSVAGVNRGGTVVGHAQTLTAGDHAFRSRDGKLEALPEPAGAQESWATGINDNGDIVGHVGTHFQEDVMSYTVHTAVLWPASAPGTVVKLSAGLPTTGQTKAKGIDQDGTVLIEHYPKRTDAFTATSLRLWRAGTARTLTPPAGMDRVEGAAISNGRVAGRATPGDAEGIGVLWEQNGTPLRLGTSWRAGSVNRSGQVTGSLPDLANGVWQLTRLVATLKGSLGVNVSADDGSVAGWSRTSDDAGRGEPTVWRCR